MTGSGNGGASHRPAVERQGRRGGQSIAVRRRFVVRPRRDWDAYTALIATLIGLVALLVSGYTAYVQRQQLRAQVWPYLLIETGNVPPFVGFHAVNSGTGPARVMAVRVQVDGQSVKNWTEAQRVVGSEPGDIIQSQLSDTVLPAGKDLLFFQPRDQDASEPFQAKFLGEKHELRVSVCYCSVLDDCWMVASDTRPNAIADADACPIRSAERFTK